MSTPAAIAMAGAAIVVAGVFAADREAISGGWVLICVGVVGAVLSA